SLSYKIPNTTFVDEPGSMLTYSASLDSGAQLPVWLSFNSQNRSLTGTPSNAEVLRIQVTAQDAFENQVSSIFNLRVNRAPQSQGSLGEEVAYVNQNLNFVIPNTLFVDPDGDSISYDAR